ncbi:amino acid ABC transporter permease [Ancylobacter defluvii]|uniref:Glutamine ABC transporter permease n=1 Tax=Ancylobacter defluvii TaxID=1282440 RepID=A0A9W6JW16_9HYPH|nr:amino acid ABC transporter permease [Ancylobacter defluvii]MBS7587608.1 amino acid ABC transporter permease [Ancylobacter defluvii]GLK82418.1 glutamine ABC transporter permease [Ancylobacter defluvii]
MDFGFILNNAPLLMEGAAMTVALAIGALLGATIGGGVVAGLRMSRHAPLRCVGAGFVEIMRNTPILVQIFVLYFGLPTLGVHMSAFTSAVLAMSLQNSAYIGEIYRAGLESIHPRQREAALALGMMPGMALRVILLPQALRRVLPPLGNQFIIIIKDTSVASTIAVAELTQASKLLLDRSAAPYETFATVALIYLAISAGVAGVLKLAEWRYPVRVS